MREDTQFHELVRECLRESLTEPPAELIPAVMKQLHTEQKLRKNRTLIRRISTGFAAAAAVLVAVTAAYPLLSPHLPMAGQAGDGYGALRSEMAMAAPVTGGSAAAGQEEADTAPANAASAAMQDEGEPQQAAQATGRLAAPDTAQAAPAAETEKGLGVSLAPPATTDNAGRPQYLLVSEQMPEALLEYPSFLTDTATMVSIPAGELEKVLSALREAGYSVEHRKAESGEKNLIILSGV